jgi:chemotaxis protein MotB
LTESVQNVVIAVNKPRSISPVNFESQEKQKMIRRFPVAIGATILAVSLIASVSMAGDEQLSQVAEQLKTALAGEQVEVAQRIVSVTLTSSADAMFPSGGWQVPSSAPVLDKIVPTLSKLENAKIVVSGYTDNVPIGDDLKAKGVTNNLDLSAERAVSIANYLTAHGVKPDIISAHAFGETNPVAPNDTPEGRAKNRRVDITLTRCCK